MKIQYLFSDLKVLNQQNSMNLQYILIHQQRSKARSRKGAKPGSSTGASLGAVEKQAWE